MSSVCLTADAYIIISRRHISIHFFTFQGITFQEFLDFTHLLRSVSELDTALTFHTLAGAAIDQATFLHVAKVVANVKLTPHLVDVVFTLFDENGSVLLTHI